MQEPTESTIVLRNYKEMLSGIVEDSINIPLDAESLKDVPKEYIDYVIRMMKQQESPEV